MDIFHASTHRNALQQVHSGDHGAGEAGFPGEILQTGLGACTPVPQGVGLILAVGSPGEIQGMVVEDVEYMSRARRLRQRLLQSSSLHPNMQSDCLPIIHAAVPRRL